MAIFGSLGKLLGLDSPTGRGFVQGFAETGTKLLQEDMKNEQEKIDRIAEYKIKKDQEEQERYQKELRENTEALRNIMGQVGGINGAEYLVRTYGIKGAIEKAGQIETLKGYGITPEFATQDENQTTLDDLANFVTSAPELYKIGKVEGGGLLSGIGLGRDISEEAQQQADSAASALGRATGVSTDLGAMPTASGFDPSDLGMMADFKDEATRQMRLAIAAKESGDEELYTVRMGKAHKMLGFARMMDNKSQVTESASRAFGKLITGHIADVAGFDTKYTMNPDGSTSVVTSWKAAEDKGRANTTGQILTELYNTAVNTHGINHATASRAIFEAVQANKLPVFVKDDAGTVTGISVGTQVLVEGGFQGGKGVYGKTQTQDTSDTVDTGAGSTATNVGADVSGLIAAHNAETSGSRKQVIKGQIARALGVGTIGQIPADIAGQLN